MSQGQELVREIDELYDRFHAVFREWVLRQGDLTPFLLSSRARGRSVSVDNVTWRFVPFGGTNPPDVENLICLCSSLKVPPYWKIPVLTDKELCLRMLLGDFKRPRSPTARYGAQIGGSILKPRPGEKDQLTINIWRYPKLDWHPKIISMSQVKLKATIAHELEHYLDPLLLDVPYNQLHKGASKATTLTEHFAYKNQSTEIRAVARHIIVLAEGYVHPIRYELDHCIAGVRRAVLTNPETDPEECERELTHYRELLAAELVRRLPELTGEL
jgi:hypothetical protein